MLSDKVIEKIYEGSMMIDINKLLEYVQKTNPTMTRGKTD